MRVCSTTPVPGSRTVTGSDSVSSTTPITDFVDLCKSSVLRYSKVLKLLNRNIRVLSLVNDSLFHNSYGYFADHPASLIVKSLHHK